jgi:uncharacterized membrane protein
MSLEDLKKKVVHKHSSKRFIEIDMLRGLAIILMIFGHILWDLDYFGLMPMNNAIYDILKITVQPMFFLLVGISLVLSRKRIESLKKIDEKEYDKRLIFRGLKILGLGIVFTILTLLFIPEKPIFFGVLHCIGLSIIISVPFLKYRNYNLIFVIILLFASLVVAEYNMENPTLFHLALGIHQANIGSYTIDYFPLLPWFGVCLLGIMLGDCLYSGDKRKFRFPDLSNYRPIKLFQWCGQHSLIIYLLHQPIIAGAISIFVIL